jgi:hypothetical protein
MRDWLPDSMVLETMGILTKNPVAGAQPKKQVPESHHQHVRFHSALISMLKSNYSAMPE